MDEDERLRRWRLILGEPAAALVPLGGVDGRMDATLQELYDAPRTGGLGGSAPRVARWLGDIRTYFPRSVVQVMQRDALDRLGLKAMLVQPEMLAAVEADIHLAATLLTLKGVLPAEARETARSVVRQVVDEVHRRLAARLTEAVRGSLNRATRRRHPRLPEIDWPRTIHANLQHYLPSEETIVPERLIGHGRRASALRDLVLCIDQSGSMAASVVYAGIFGAVLASIRSLTTRLVVFDTSVVDLTEYLHDPVELLFGTQLGGGTDINRALAYCEGIITRPSQTVLVLISDLFEGGNRAEMLGRAAALVERGVAAVCLLALSDTGAPAHDASTAGKLAALGIPTFACPPDQFPDLIAAALSHRDLELWAARNDIVTARGSTG